MKRSGRSCGHMSHMKERYMPEPTLSVYEEIGNRIGSLVTEKNAAYGDSFGQASKILEVLYTDGIKPHQYCDALAIVRVIDKFPSSSKSRTVKGGPSSSRITSCPAAASS